MTATNQYQGDYSIYPGQFEPMFKEEEIQEQLFQTRHQDIVHPPAQIRELQDAYMVSVIVPGLKREEILIKTDKNILFMYAMHQSDTLYETESFLLHKLKNECFIRDLELPPDADTEFANAEYRDGVLKLYVPKTTTPLQTGTMTIIVY